MSKMILVVDDEDLVLSTLVNVFERAGYEVESARSGHEVLDVLKKKDIQVCFVDLKMPDMDGLELCRRIKELNPKAHVHALTGHATDYDIAKCREAGFDDYFLKPFKVETIRNAADAAFAKIQRWET